MPKNPTPTVFLMLTLMACSGSANLIRKDRVGGRVQLTGAYVPAMADARMLMVEHCNGHFETAELDHALEFRCHGSAIRVDGAALQRMATRSQSRP